MININIKENNTFLVKYEHRLVGSLYKHISIISLNVFVYLCFVDSLSRVGGSLESVTIIT